MSRERHERLKLVPNRLLDLAHRDPVVYSILTAYANGYVEYTAALESLVIALAAQKRTVTESLVKAVQANPAPIVIEGGVK
jgi:hypothetical protein